MCFFSSFHPKSSYPELPCTSQNWVTGTTLRSRHCILKTSESGPQRGSGSLYSLSEAVIQKDNPRVFFLDLVSVSAFSPLCLSLPLQLLSFLLYLCCHLSFLLSSFKASSLFDFFLILIFFRLASLILKSNKGLDSGSGKGRSFNT